MYSSGVVWWMAVHERWPSVVYWLWRRCVYNICNVIIFEVSTLEVLYLFGGWDGSKSLADLWQYNISSAQWHQISADTSSEVRGCRVCKYSYNFALGWTKSLFMPQNVFWFSEQEIVCVRTLYWRRPKEYRRVSCKFSPTHFVLVVLYYFLCRVHCTATVLENQYGVYYPVILMLMVARNCCMIIR